MGKGIGGHHSSRANTIEWLTPPEIVRSLGTFELDPCSPVNRPWDTAARHIVWPEDGLAMDWTGYRVWLNPPYTKHIIDLWMAKLARQGDGISITYARTETKWFQSSMPYADSVFFFSGRLHFYHANGQRADDNAGGPNCLIAFGERNAQAISDSGLQGIHLPVRSVPMVIVGVSPSWQSVVRIVFSRLSGDASVDMVYSMVEEIAPDKVRKNPSYKEKIRQTLQRHFIRVDRGVYTTTKS